ncbi:MULTISPECIES: hypothetical protein [unclassified Legionella]|uniref:hypothetical protein n=1 Tax=unclassified Legionella TaxID=2622702 RepID=UPI0010541A6F|nr:MULTISPECIES: hypothetical protein [unclassified Legionella]MDI9819049.1 hypothetical protein [Legionella sp. PL877]
MPEFHKSDLHLHLNGSFSLSFLRETAAQHQCLEIFQEFEAVRDRYLGQTQQQPESGYNADIIALVWKQFALIHKIIQDLTDISNGVIDVVSNSTAKYLEIRTTPKIMAGHSESEYIDVFEAGLKSAKEQIAKKKAVGLLSLDRTQHTLKDAQFFIERIKKSPNKLLVGLDISGNPLGHRTLTGEGLKEVILMALDNEIPIAIHMGESDSEIERQDSDVVLSALQQWRISQAQTAHNPFHGKVRLGHCIYLTREQKGKITQLGVPVEVCPSCHNKLNWHFEHSPHPATGIYEDISEPVVVGTDDECIFGSSAKVELTLLLGLFSNRKNLSRQALKEHHETFRFSAIK